MKAKLLIAALTVGFLFGPSTSIAEDQLIALGEPIIILKTCKTHDGLVAFAAGPIQDLKSVHYRLYLGKGDAQNAKGLFYDWGWVQDERTNHQRKYLYEFSGSVDYETERDICLDGHHSLYGLVMMW